MCTAGYVPAGRMRANCTSDGITVDGTWTPDPATLTCNGEIIEQQVPDQCYSKAHIMMMCNLET